MLSFERPGVTGSLAVDEKDMRLTVNLGLRLPFFKRDLNNFCFTSSASGFVECTGQNPDLNDIAEGNNPDQPGRLVQWLYPRTPFYTWVVPGIWYDIGSKESLEEANKVFASEESLAAAKS